MYNVRACVRCVSAVRACVRAYVHAVRVCVHVCAGAHYLMSNPTCVSVFMRRYLL